MVYQMFWFTVMFICMLMMYSGTPKENIDSYLDYINYDLVRIDNWTSAN